MLPRTLFISYFVYAYAYLAPSILAREVTAATATVTSTRRLRKNTKKSKKGKKEQGSSKRCEPTGKLGGRKIQCDASAKGFYYDPPLPYDQQWHYPKDQLSVGFLNAPDAVLPAASYSLPLNTEDAVSKGWAFEQESCKWVCDENSNTTLCPITRLKLSFMDDSIFAVEVLAEPFYGDHFFSETGYELFFNSGEDNEFALFDHCGEEFPISWPEAQKSGWLEGSCVQAMGGYHAYQLPFTFEAFKPLTPIYDVGGGQAMSAALLVMAPVANPFMVPGFDFFGGHLSGTLGCDFNFCDGTGGKEGCLEAMYDLTGGSTDPMDLSAFSSSLHVFWDVNPAVPATWGTCLCPPGPCSCCGGVPRTDCLPATPPIYPDGFMGDDY